MALNKERKVLLGLLGSAGLILVADQVLFGPPRGANAGQAAPGVQPPPTPTAQGTDTPAGQPSTLEMSAEANERVGTWNERLGEATAESPLASGIADPFSALEQHEPEPTGVMTPLAFQQQHELSAVMTGGDMGIAMINKKPVRIGQTVSGYRLVSVDARSAVFEAGGQTVRLALPKQGGGGS